ncbi:hypothetical protein L596_018445 [Steinernema carpocapsae]|uniref:PDZ domain-containing protein n=1 Tax=Steinernema carpocapsae TaxID=34508 RepID=A0A4V6A232_STECR|nr:hypothetical protein L596_018445 [Steinernema carpocapsae]
MEVKVFYYLNEGDVPYVSVLNPASGAAPTLGDFKKVFNRAGFKYYCKELDTDIGREVKVELTDDKAPLLRAGSGLIELFLVQQQQQNFNSGTLPRTGKQNHEAAAGAAFEPGGRLKKRRSLYGLSSVDGFDIGGGQRVSMVTNEQSLAESSQGTVLSRRAGEHLADMYATNSEDPYNMEDPSASSFSAASSAYGGIPIGNNGRLPQNRHRKPRKERYRKAYVPSTISSAAESSLTSQSLPRIDVIKVSMKNAITLGIKVVGHDGGIFVSLILPDGAASQDGRLEVGDQIVQINEESFENLNDQQAVSILKKASKSKRSVTLYVSKRPRAHDDGSSDVLTGMTANETMPLNISSWVKSTMHRKVEKHVPFQSVVGESTLDPSESMTIADETSDEEQAAYLDRRGGVGPRFVPALGMRNQIAEDVFMRQKENDENDVMIDTLSVNMDPRIILKVMAKPDSGLQIKNRKWLKILVPMSFIGSGLVDWLLMHVQGLHDRKSAREYASQLLQEGLIRHVVNKMTFTEKCYYVFDESIMQMANRGSRGGAHSSGGEVTTEVTYVGSPAPGTDKTQPRPLDSNLTVQNANVNATWPISPITLYGNQTARRCESPAVTNDYASMIGTEFVQQQHQMPVMMPSEAPTLKIGTQSPSTRSPFFPPPPPSLQRSMSPPPNTPNTLLSSVLLSGATGSSRLTHQQSSHM